MIVVDTNVLVYAVRPGQFTEAALRAKKRDPQWLAPTFWRLEMSNVLALSIRLEGLEPAIALEAFSAAESLVQDLEIRPTPEETLRLAQEGQISAYDAEFIFAAERPGTQLLTGDRRLIQAFPQLTKSITEFGSTS